MCHDKSFRNKSNTIQFTVSIIKNIREEINDES